MKLLPRIIGRGCECCRLFMRLCVWLGVSVCAGEGGALDWWLPLWMGSRGQGEANRLFPQSVLQRPPLTHGAARRRAGSHGKRGTNKTTAPIHKSQGPEGRGMNGAGWRSEKREREKENGTKPVSKSKVIQFRSAGSYCADDTKTMRVPLSVVSRV